ncbi:uncharacterized protein LOC144664703 [Oculina patagonica]
MTHITIRLASPPAGSKNIREIIRIKTPEKLLPISEASGSFIVETEDRNLSMDETCFEDKMKQMVNGNSQGLPPFEGLHSSAEGNGPIYVDTCETRKEDSNRFTPRINTENGSKINGTAVHDGETELNCQGKSQTQCDSCGRPIEREGFESELYITRKDLASVQNQLVTFKARLEEELIERFKLEEELRSEAESHQSELRTLKEKIECLEENECEKSRRVEELENMIAVYKEEHEKSCEEVEILRNFVGKYQSELCKLRAEAHNASDQAVEAMNEMELLTKKMEKSEQEKDKIKKQLQSEMEEYWREVRELRSALENWERLDVERKTRIQTLENEVASYKGLVDELREELTECSNKTTNQENNNSKMDPAKSEHLLMLCHELNEIFREHLSSQGKFSELSFVLAATQKELEEARNRSQSQNLALQEFKRNYNDLHDTMVALNEENRHLRNSLEKKCTEFTEIRRKFLVSETEVSWLKEALSIVDSSKRKTLCKSMEVAS